MGGIAGGIGRPGQIMCDYRRFAAYTLLEAIIIVACSPMSIEGFLTNIL